MDTRTQVTDRLVEDIDALVKPLTDHADPSVDIALGVVRDAISLCMQTLEENVKPGREFAIVRTNLEQAGLWAIAAIARRGARSTTLELAERAAEAEE